MFVRMYTILQFFLLEVTKSNDSAIHFGIFGDFDFLLELSTFQILLFWISFHGSLTGNHAKNIITPITLLAITPS